jgi:hypothetical protein
MKRFLSVVIALSMALCLVPSVSFAESANTLKAVRTAYFNSAAEWKLTDSSTNSDNVLMASSGSDGWQADSSFTDTDGTVTTQSSLSGTSFATPRNALVAFEIPTDVDFSNIARVTLSLTVKNVKQVTSGARLAVYGNSVIGSSEGGAWSLSDGKELFGASGSDSGLSELKCLGLTSAISTGNQTGESASGETITLSSAALRDYIAQTAENGYSEVTFRLAAPLGGIRIYDNNTQYAPTLTLEEGELTNQVVKTVLYNEDGSYEVESEETIANLILGETYTYSVTPEAYKVVDNSIYTYSEEKSILSVKAGMEEIVIAYVKYDGEDSFNGYEFASEGAWCWFADPRTISYKNDDGTIDTTIIGYIDVHGNIKATQINNITNKVDEILIRSNIQPDDHNNPTFLVLPDERIVVFYSRHTDEPCFWYRVTKEKGDLTTLGEEKCLKTSNNTTYPSPFILSDDPDNIYLCWRGIGWHPTIAKLSLPDENGDMHFTYGPYQMVQSTGARPYAKYASNGKDKIYVSYTTGHPDNENPNWLYFNQINISDMTLEDINGNTLSTIANGTLAVNKTNSSQSFIVDSPSSGTRDWLWQVAVAKDGYPVIAMVRIDGGKTSHDYYYVKWNGSSWTKTFLTNAGGRFHSSNTEYCYSGGMGIDSDNPNVIYCSKPVQGVFGNVFEIFKYTMSDDGTTIESVEQITKNSRKNNVRPFVIPGSDGDERRVIWMNGDYAYWMVNKNYPSGFPTSAMINAPLPEEEVSLDDAVSPDYELSGDAFVSTKETQNEVVDSIESESGQSFAVSADIYLSGDYEGEILDMGNVSLRVEYMSKLNRPAYEQSFPRLVLNVNGTDYLSENVYGTSDDWKYYSTGTTGDYYFTKYDKYVNLSINYDGEYLTLYRDALVDVKVPVKDLSVDKLLVGGFEGYAKNVKFFERTLNYDELHEISSDKDAVSSPSVEGGNTVTVNYVTDSGKTLIPSETVELNPYSDYFTLKRNEQIVVNGAVYVLNEEKSKLVCALLRDDDLTVTAVYDKLAATGENLVPSGSFEDEDGNFDWGTWQSPQGDGYFKDICSTWFYKVNRDTDASAYYTDSIEADNFALGTRWNDGTTGLCSMANFIPVEAGKTYKVSYDYKHKTAGTDASYIRTTFQKDMDFSADDSSDNNTPDSVTTSWQTNEFAITAPEDGYIYFHFSFVGSGGSTNTSGNLGEGPYWYFDNFAVYELEAVPDVDVNLNIESVENASTTLSVTNKTKNDLSSVSVYVASIDENGTVTNVEVQKLDLASGETKTLSFGVGGNVKAFVWNEKMNPLNDVSQKNAE